MLIHSCSWCFPSAISGHMHASALLRTGFLCLACCRHLHTCPWKVLGQVQFWIALWNMELSMDVIHCFTSATCYTCVISLPGYLRKHICFQALVTYEILCPDKYFIYLGPWVLFGCLSSVMFPFCPSCLFISGFAWLVLTSQYSALVGVCCIQY